MASDSTHFRSWDQNLFTEWHSRYGGRRRDYGISRQTVYQYPQPTAGTGEAELAAVLAVLPPDTRPLPSVAAYDELLQRRKPARGRTSKTKPA